MNRKILRREIFIYFVLLVVLGFGMHHKELISHPIEHFENIVTAPLGIFHPFVFTFVVYLVILVFRLFFKIFRKFAQRGS